MNLFIMPHPPLAIEQIGQGKEIAVKATVEAMNRIAEKIKSLAPRTIAVITPHGNVFSDGLCINIEDKLSGNFVEFGQPRVQMELNGDFQKALVLCSGLRASGINCLALDQVTAKKYEISTELDHGAMVPLHFILKQYKDFRLLHINIGYLPKTQMYQAGKILAEIMGEDNVIIASGDLSHRLNKQADDYDEMGEAYDRTIAGMVKDNNFLGILSLDENMVQKAGQCAQKPMEMLIGAMDGYSAQGQVYSYEAPYGVGYMTAHIECTHEDKEHLISQYLQIKKDIEEKNKVREDEYISLARKAINTFVEKHEKIDVPGDASEELCINQAGVFVTIKREGRLRGCIGTMSPTKASIAEEIIDNAIQAAVKDSRFTEVQMEELGELEISVDVLSHLEDVESKEQLDINQYGIVVTKDYRRGLLLPNLSGVKDVDNQIEIALEKAGIDKDGAYRIQRFSVERHQIKD